MSWPHAGPEAQRHLEEEIKTLPKGSALRRASRGSWPPTKGTGFMFQVKKLCCREDKSSVSVVYEDMSYSCRNRMSTPNEYQ